MQTPPKTSLVFKDLLKERKKLVERLKEANLPARRFLRLGYETKVACDDGWYNFPYIIDELQNEPSIGVSGGLGLVLIDVDNQEFEKVFRGLLPRTFETKSGGKGLPHFYYKVTGHLPNNCVIYYPTRTKSTAGEIRVNHQYTVSCGSHIDYVYKGKRIVGDYTILQNRPIAEISYQEFMDKILPYLGTHGDNQKLTIEDLENGVQEGERHPKGIRVANYLIGVKKLSPKEALEAIREWNQKNKPPMPDKDIKRMINEALSHQSNPTVQAEYQTKKRENGISLIPSTFDEQLWKSTELVRHIFSDLGRRVKHDNVTKAAVFFSGLSAYLPDPLNLFEKGSSGSGKTYNAIETLTYFPQDDIWYLSGMSPKALVHQKSQLLDRDGNEIFLSDRPTKPKKKDFKKEEEEEYKKAQEEYELQNKEFNRRIRESYHYINIENKIFVFLETPHPETMRMIYPILSHDKLRIEYRFVNKTSAGLRTELVVIEGFPSAIFLTTDRQYVEELATRAFTVSPEESTEKIGDANKLTNLKSSLPWECELENPRFLGTKKLIQTIKETLKTTKTDVIIPFLDLHELFPKDVARDMRDFSHFTQFLKSWTILHIFQRPCVVIGEKTYILSNNYDVYQCFQIFKDLIESTRTGTEKRILNFYRDFMLGKEETIYVSSLTTAYNEKNKTKVSDFTIRKWLNRLNQIGYVEKQEDEHDKRKYIYVPLVEEDPENLENVCDSETQTKIASSLEIGFKSWLDRYLKTDLGKLKKIFASYP